MDSYTWIILHHPSGAVYSSGLGVHCDLATIYIICKASFILKEYTYCKHINPHINERFAFKQEIAANCEKYIRAKDTQVSLMIFSSEFKLVKPFVFLSFIFESTDRYNVFHMTHT